MKVYADNAATTKIKECALEAMRPWLFEKYANASSLYSIAGEASKVLEDSRKIVAEALGVSSKEIFFTSGGTEADNWVLKCGVPEGDTFITTEIEHPAILTTSEYLAKNKRRVLKLKADKYGHPLELEEALKLKPAIVSIMAANNEIGTVLNIKKYFSMVKEISPETKTHTDAVQAIGHIPVSMENVDMLSLSGHKFGGPKGVGALFIRKGVRLEPLLHGGGQENRKRASTENIAGIAGMAAALSDAVNNLDKNRKYTEKLRDKLIEGVLKIPAVILTGDPLERLPGLASFIIEAVEGETLIMDLDKEGIYASTGSACSSKSLKTSHVLTAIDMPQELSHGSLRLSLNEDNTEQEIDYIIEKLWEIIRRRRSISPLWDEENNRSLLNEWR